MKKLLDKEVNFLYNESNTGSKLPRKVGKMLSIEKRRVEMGLSQKYVAEQIGISDRAYRDIEKGKSRPAFKAITGMERFFDISYVELLKQI